MIFERNFSRPIILLDLFSNPHWNSSRSSEPSQEYNQDQTPLARQG